MPEHVIRLRGGWEWEDLDAPHSCPTRITLPTHFHSGEACRRRLTRRFGRPPIDCQAETLWLRIERAPGLESVAINGSAIPLEPGGTSPLELALRELPERNLLELQVSLPGADSLASALDSSWGEIALVVRPAAH